MDPTNFSISSYDTNVDNLPDSYSELETTIDEVR